MSDNARSIIYIVVGAVVIVILIVMGVYTLMKRKKKDAPNNAPKERIAPLADDDDLFTHVDAEEDDDIFLSVGLSDDAPDAYENEGSSEPDFGDEFVDVTLLGNENKSGVQARNEEYVKDDNEGYDTGYAGDAAEDDEFKID